MKCVSLVLPVMSVALKRVSSALARLCFVASMVVYAETGVILIYIWVICEVRDPQHSLP